MGIEYQLRFAPQSAAVVAESLGRHYAARAVPGPEPRFDFGGEPGAPDASAWVGPDGVLFCDHLGAGGREALGVVVGVLAALGPITVEEL